MGFDAPKSDWSLNWQCTIDLIGQFQISNCAPKLANQSPVVHLLATNGAVHYYL